MPTTVDFPTLVKQALELFGDVFGNELADDGSFYGEISVCNGVYANAATLEECREQLAEVVVRPRTSRID